MAAVDRHAEWTSVEKVLDYLTRADAIPHRTEGEGVLLDHLPERVERVLDLGWRCSPASSRPADPDPGGWDRRSRQEGSTVLADLLHLGIPVAEKVVRTVGVYVGLAVLLRLGGKRDLAELNSFDLLVVLLLSNVVQNAIIGDDNSLTGGLLGAVVLVAVNASVVRGVARGPRLSRWFEGSPTVLVRDGRIDEAALRREGLRRSDLVAAVRRQSASSLDEVAEATLAPGGTIVVRLRPEDEDATHGDVAQLRERLDQIAAQLDTLLARAAPPRPTS